MKFRKGWWATELEGYRDIGMYNTYALVPFDTLPEITWQDFKGKFGWLKPLSEQETSQMEVHWEAQGQQDENTLRVDQLAKNLQERGLSLPDGFYLFFSNVEMQNSILSSTACYFTIPTEPLPTLLEKDSYFIRFLSDQQECLLWYVYSSPRGSSIVCSGYNLDEFLDTGRDDIDEIIEHFKEEIVEVESTFERFMYRLWMEGKLWFKLSDSDDNFTYEESLYLNGLKKYKSPEEEEEC
ncbi:MAG: hypothetical protein ACFFCS_19720 [Candidatus Hodarchaeota archaeon]